GAACDAAPARQDYSSPEDMDAALTPCYHAQTWIECRSDASAEPYGVVCPGGSDLTAWGIRFREVNQRWVDMTGQPDYYSTSFAIAKLQPNRLSGVSAGARELRQAVNAAAPALDLSL